MLAGRFSSSHDVALALVWSQWWLEQVVICLVVGSCSQSLNRYYCWLFSFLVEVGEEVAVVEGVALDKVLSHLVELVGAHCI